MPITTASWCNVPRAPLYALGAISPIYMGTNPVVNPGTQTLNEFLEEGSHFSSDNDVIAGTAVKAHNETAWDDHDVRFPAPAESHQQSSNYSQNIDHQHSPDPVRQKRWQSCSENTTDGSGCVPWRRSPSSQVSHKSHQEGGQHATYGEDRHRQRPIHGHVRMHSQVWAVSCVAAVAWHPLHPQGPGIVLFYHLGRGQQAPSGVKHFTADHQITYTVS